MFYHLRYLPDNPGISRGEAAQPEHELAECQNSTTKVRHASLCAISRGVKRQAAVGLVRGNVFRNQYRLVWATNHA
jgi:hypothetical protein